MSDQYITLMERIRFKDGVAIAWERSWGGRPFEPVPWPGGCLPFVMIDKPGAVDIVVRSERMALPDSSTPPYKTL